MYIVDQEFHYKQLIGIGQHTSRFARPRMEIVPTPVDMGYLPGSSLRITRNLHLGSRDQMLDNIDEVTKELSDHIQILDTLKGSRIWHNHLSRQIGDFFANPDFNGNVVTVTWTRNIAVTPGGQFGTNAMKGNIRIYERGDVPSTLKLQHPIRCALAKAPRLFFRLGRVTHPNRWMYLVEEPWEIKVEGHSHRMNLQKLAITSVSPKMIYSLVDDGRTEEARSIILGGMSADHIHVPMAGLGVVQNKLYHGFSFGSWPADGTLTHLSASVLHFLPSWHRLAAMGFEDAVRSWNCHRQRNKFGVPWN